jgi:hypothetical protein
MSFDKFLSEAPLTTHAKVEGILREQGLQYKVENITTGRKLTIEGTKIVILSYNFGKVTVSKDGTIIGSADSLSKKFRDDLYALIKEVVEGNKTATKQDKKEKS